jgi:hypothetical protein
MALGILTAHQKRPDGTLPPLTDDEKVLRRWAVRLLDRQAPEKFTLEEQRALLAVTQPFGQLSAQEQADEAMGALFGRIFLEAIRKEREASPQPSVPNK